MSDKTLADFLSALEMYNQWQDDCQYAEYCHLEAISEYQVSGQRGMGFCGDNFSHLMPYPELTYPSPPEGIDWIAEFI